MSISPAEMAPQSVSAQNPRLPGCSLQASVRVAAMVGESSDESSAPAPPASSLAQLSTDMRVDDQHQVYYEFVDASTGNVLFEIPPEALRAIGESLSLPLDGEAGAHSLDVKS